MSFDFSALITDRTQADVNYAKALAARISAGTASEAELAEFNSAAMKGAYNHTDLNRVTAAMDALKAKLEGYGYAVPGYQRIKVPHVLPEPEPTSKLPEGYTELTYIESTGTQYIDTGFKPNNNTRVVMDALFATVPSTTSALFGARVSATDRNYALIWSSSGAVRSDYNNAYTQTWSVAADTRRLYDKDGETTTIDGTAQAYTSATFQTPYSLYLCASNNAGTASWLAPLKLYSCQIYDNGVLVRDYVPCINPDGDVGLYDAENGQFYGNTGTGVFMAGDRVGVALPEGYTRLTYIESTGTQYVNTKFKPNQNTRISMDFHNSGDYSGMTTSLCPLFGARNASTSAVFAMWIGTKTFPQYGNVAYNANGNFTTDLSSRLTYDLNKNVASIGGDSITCSSATFTTNYDLHILAMHNYGSIDSRHPSGKLYSCQIYDNGTLIRDFVPCINPGGSVGLYDLVTAAFFGNSGTGSFVAGAIPRELPKGYTQVEYIESTGTQYINTGINPNSNTRIVADMEITSGTTSFLFGARHNSSANATSYSFSMVQISGASLRSDFGSVETAVSVSPVQRLAIDKNGNATTVNGTTVTATAQSFSGSYNLALFTVNTAGTINSTKTSAKLYSCQIYDNGVLVRDFVPCKKSGGVFGLYDLANDVFYQNAGSGAFTAGEEVVAPANASAMVVFDNAADYEPYTWYEFDWPTPETMTIYLLNVSAIRAVLVVLRSTPEVPTDMERLMAQEANNIEAILLDVCRQLSIMPTTFIPCGEALCGGDNL